MSPAVITDDERIAEMRQRAISEVVPGIVVYVDYRTHPGRTIYRYRGGARTPEFSAVTLRAARLTNLTLYGPEFPALCDDHHEFDRPDRWDVCRKVSVASALLGRTCGAS